MRRCWCDACKRLLLPLERAEDNAGFVFLPRRLWKKAAGFSDELAILVAKLAHTGTMAACLERVSIADGRASTQSCGSLLVRVRLIVFPNGIVHLANRDQSIVSAALWGPGHSPIVHRTVRL